jgi:hypothetical protein
METKRNKEKQKKRKGQRNSSAKNDREGKI